LLSQCLAECGDVGFVSVRSDGETPRFVLVSEANGGSEVIALPAFGVRSCVQHITVGHLRTVLHAVLWLRFGDGLGISVVLV